MSATLHPALAEPIGATRLRRKRKLDAFAALVPLPAPAPCLEARRAIRGGGEPWRRRADTGTSGPDRNRCAIRPAKDRGQRSARPPTSSFPASNAARRLLISRFDVKLGSVSPGPSEKMIVKDGDGEDDEDDRGAVQRSDIAAVRKKTADARADGLADINSVTVFSATLPLASGGPAPTRRACCSLN